MKKKRAAKPKTKHVGTCLDCGQNAVLTRGLCGTCYSRFDRARKRFPANARMKYERRLIALGKLEPNRQGQRSDLPERENIYDIVAAEMLAAEPESEYHTGGKHTPR